MTDTTSHTADPTVDRDDHVRSVLAKVPEISVIFWALKLLTTGMGEAISDAIGQKSVPLAAAVGIFGMGFALWLQMRQTEYKAPYYWFAVMMVAVFGTMAADAIHDGVGVGYGVTTPAFALLSAFVFWRWYRAEGTLDFHAITTRRRERFYWLAVLCTFALGTAAGDLTSMAMNLGFWPSALIFGAIMCIPALGWYQFGLDPIAGFWFAYVVTRPLGASFADGFSKNTNGGLAIFVSAVTWVTVKRIDVQPPHEFVPHPHHPHHAHDEPSGLGIKTD